MTTTAQLPNARNRETLIAMLHAPGTPPQISDEITQFATDDGDHQPTPDNIWRIIDQYPNVVAALVWQSAFYYQAPNAAEVALAFLRADDTALEWHFHISAVGKMSLKEANDAVIQHAIENLIHLGPVDKLTANCETHKRS